MGELYLVHLFLEKVGVEVGFLSIPLLTTYYVFLVFILATLLVSVMGGVNLVLFFDPNIKESELRTTYECGFIPFTNRRLNFNINFHVVAILFIIFDLEVLFLFPWVVNLPFIGLFGFYSMVVFFALLVLGLILEFRSGILSI